MKCKLFLKEKNDIDKNVLYMYIYTDIIIYTHTEINLSHVKEKSYVVYRKNDSPGNYHIK